MAPRLCRIAALLPALLLAEKGEPDISGMLGGLGGGIPGIGGGGGGNKIDVKGMENALKNGGPGALNDMLSSISAMSALHSNDKESLHIKKDENGNDMYDFTNPTTTPAPAPPPVPRPPPMKPKPVVKAVATPPVDMKKVSDPQPPKPEVKSSVAAKVMQAAAATPPRQQAAPTMPSQPQEQQPSMQTPMQPQQPQQTQMVMQQPQQMQMPPQQQIPMQMMGMPQQQFFQPMQQMPQLPQWAPQQFALQASELNTDQRKQLEQNLLGMKMALEAMEGSLGWGPAPVNEDQIYEDTAKAQKKLEKRMRTMEKNNKMLRQELDREMAKFDSVQAEADKQEQALALITKENDLLRKSTSLLSQDLAYKPKQEVIKEFYHHKTPATPAPDSQ